MVRVANEAMSSMISVMTALCVLSNMANTVHTFACVSLLSRRHKVNASFDLKLLDENFGDPNVIFACQGSRISILFCFRSAERQ